MKRVFMLLLAAVFPLALFGDDTPNEQKMPKKVIGDRGPKIVVFAGARPWIGAVTADLFSKKSFRILCLDSVYLDGLGGATIKVHLTDKVEPKPFDGITPVFNKLNSFKLLFFNINSEVNMSKLFTQERIEKLKKYVENGGQVIFTDHVPRTLTELLPVELGEFVEFDGKLDASKPTSKYFAALPEKSLPVYKQYREATPYKDCEVLSSINIDGKEIPYIARRKIGKGAVTFINLHYQNPAQMLEFGNWAYRSMFMTALAADCLNYEKIDFSDTVVQLPAYPDKRQVGEVSASVLAPVLELTPETREVRINGNEAFFADGSKLVVNPDSGAVDFYLPGILTPMISNYEIPKLTFSKKQVAFDDNSAEAVNVKSDTQSAKIKWTFNGITASPNGEAILKYSDADNAIEWIFQAGSADLDGRKFTGFKDRVNILKSKLLIHGVLFHSELTVPDPVLARRNSCYAAPRGYSDFDMSGKTKADTSKYNVFGSAQPFEMVVCKNGIYTGFPDGIQNTTLRLMREPGKNIQSTRSMIFGRLRAPLQSVDYWHLYSEGVERPENDYMTIYQFVRKNLRRIAGLKELFPYPHGRYNYTLTPNEKQKVIDACAKAGYRYIMPPMPESPIAEIACDRNLLVYKNITDTGASVRIWTAGSYEQGDNGWIFNNHPEWFLRDEKGDFHKYFGSYPAIDINNDKFFDWVTENVYQKAIDAGVKWFYRDMDGAASGGINYALPEGPTGLLSQVKVYRFFHDRDVRVGIEGMNCLVLDEYWYRADLYTSFVGREYTLIGQKPGGDLKGALGLDPFRTGMYGCFIGFQNCGWALNFDRIPGEVERANRATELVPKFNEAVDITSMPFIRSTEFGATWTGKDGGVLFFWNPTKKATITLPPGWKIRGVDGNVLTDVPADSIYFIDKQ